MHTLCMLAMAAVAYVNYYLLAIRPNENDESYYLDKYNNECAGIKLACWSLFGVQSATFLFSAMCLCGLEKKCCSNLGLLALFFFDIVMLMWS